MIMRRKFRIGPSWWMPVGAVIGGVLWLVLVKTLTYYTVYLMGWL